MKSRFSHSFAITLLVAVFSLTSTPVTAGAYEQPFAEVFDHPPYGFCVNGEFVYMTTSPLNNVSISTGFYMVRNEPQFVLAYYAPDRGEIMELTASRVLREQNELDGKRIERVGDTVWITDRDSPLIDLTASCKPSLILTISRPAV